MATAAENLPTHPQKHGHLGWGGCGPLRGQERRDPEGTTTTFCPQSASLRLRLDQHWQQRYPAATRAARASVETSGYNLLTEEGSGRPVGWACAVHAPWARLRSLRGRPLEPGSPLQTLSNFQTCRASSQLLPSCVCAYWVLGTVFSTMLRRGASQPSLPSGGRKC